MTVAMEMGYDFDEPPGSAGSASRIGRFGQPFVLRGEGGEVLAEPCPDWTALRARFLAIHALRQALAAGVDAILPAGAFVDAGRAVLASCRQAVNHTYSANGKVAWPINEAVAGLPTPGDRGIQ